MEKRKEPIWTKDFIGITLINLLTFCGFQMLLPTLPIYIKSLGAPDSAIGWIAGLATIASLMVRPFSGLALDKFGRKGVLLAGIGEIIIVTLAYMLFPIVGFILAIRFLHGLGWGAANTASNTVATDIIPKDRFGEGMGFFSLSTSLAMALAPGIGLAVLSSYHVTGLMLLSAGFSAASMLLSLFIKYRPAIPVEQEKKKLSPYERSSIRPTIVMFLITASFGSVTGFISLYAVEKGIDNIGAFFMILAASTLVSRPIFGRLIDRKGFHYAVYPGLILVTSAMFLLSQASFMSLLLLTAFLYGIGFGAVQSSLQAMSVIRAPKDRFGAANATFFTGFDGGIGFGSVIAGIVASTAGYSQMFFIFSLFPITAGLLYFVIARKVY